MSAPPPFSPLLAFLDFSIEKTSFPAQEVEEQKEQPGKNRGAQEKTDGQREHPSEEDVPQGTFLQARPVRKHRSGDTGGQNVRGANSVNLVFASSF